MEDFNQHAADPIEELLTTYAELNSEVIDELHEAPSALEFMRYIAQNRPFVVRHGVQEWDAIKKWNIEYLKATLRSEVVNVAITPIGNADSPLTRDDGSLVFVKPWEEDQKFVDFIQYLTQQELNSESQGEEVRYAQTQNDNLRGEYATIFGDVEKDIPWARIALQSEPEAINIWIGNSRSVTALHKDNYENIYCQIVGQKHFVLLPPLAHSCVREMRLPPAAYVRMGNQLVVVEEQAEAVPFPTFDPDTPNLRTTPYSHLAKPMRVSLHPGDMLYLPTQWYHKVSQSSSSEGLCCAVNYWYDMEYRGAFFPSTAFVRNISLNGNREHL